MLFGSISSARGLVLAVCHVYRKLCCRSRLLKNWFDDDAEFQLRARRSSSACQPFRCLVMSIDVARQRGSGPYQCKLSLSQETQQAFRGAFGSLCCVVAPKSN